ncbi:hypothetical protein FIBSPDRAFT_891907 [Athelia psychrophila]|uniref:Uncharacterized protein n=1 Tax=Athelia psychrophila TaxID=1759441 RepID=A0A166J124_9AGAM|nr:hypothetical protein FIBSPDRAFT_891907 [Fibularhizoctonia sp. CBS 109695]
MCQAIPTLPQIPVFLHLTSDKTDEQAPRNDADYESPDPLDHILCPSSITSSQRSNRPPMPAPRPAIHVPTHPSSPTANAALHRDLYKHSCLITRGGLIHCLEAEADRIRQMSPSDRIMHEEPGYAEYEARMRQTLERIAEMTEGDIEHAPFPPGSEHAPSPCLPAPAANDSAEPEQPAAPTPAAPDPPAYDDLQGCVPQCPVHPPNTTDPRNIRIEDQSYYPGGANNYVHDSTIVKGYVCVHVKKSYIIKDTCRIHPDEIETYTKLGGNLDSYYWPRHIQQANEFSPPLPKSTATNYHMRFQEMLFQHKEYEVLIHQVNDLLSSRQKAECCSSFINLYQTKTDVQSQTLIPVHLDRPYPVSYVPPITFYYTEAIVSTPNILTVSSVPPLTTIGRSANCYASHTGLSTPEKPNPRAPGSVQSSTCTRTTRTLTRTRVWKMGAHHQKGPSAVHTKRRRRAATGKEHCTQPKSVNAAVHQTAKQSGKYSVRPPLNLWRRNHPALTSKLAASLSAIFLIATLASVPGIRYTSLTLSTISALDVMLVLAVPVTNLCTLLTSISFDRIVIDAM